jgi:hypothetical protein
MGMAFAPLPNKALRIIPALKIILRISFPSLWDGVI